MNPAWTLLALAVAVLGLLLFVRRLAARRPSAWVLGPVDAPLLRVERVPAGDAAGELLPAPAVDALRGGLDPLIQLARGARRLQATTLELVLSPELQQRLAEGSATWLRSAELAGGFKAILVDPATKQIVGHGALVRVVDAAAVAAGVWQLAAVATAQAHLSDIDDRLRGLDRGVAGVAAWLRDGLLADVEADVAHLHRVAAAATSGPVSDADRAAWAGTLEATERHLASAMRHLERQLATIPPAVEAHAERTWTGSGLQEATAPVAADVQRHGELVGAYVVAAHGRVIGARLRVALGLHPAQARAILDAVRAEVAAAAEAPDVLRRLLADKARRLDSRVGWAGTVDAARKVVLGLADQAGDVSELQAVIAAADAPEPRVPAVLRVDVDADGSVRSARAMPAEASTPSA